jgi:2-iminobutanoate/2-iminopropanoate deaminase
VTDRQEFRVEGLPEPFSHYTDAVSVGDLLFVSGCVSVDEGGAVVGAGDVVAQARQVFVNLGLILEAAGSSFADVAKVTTFLTDIADRSRINPIRQEFFGEARPASTLVEVSALVLPEFLLEVEAVALIPRGGSS